MDEAKKPIIIANEIRMKADLFEGVFIVVEGPTDIKWLREVMDATNTKIIISYNKANSLEIRGLMSLEPYKRLHIIDADFDRLRDVSQEDSCTLYADAHDVEMMMLKSMAFERLMYHLGSSEKIDTSTPPTYKEEILNVLEKIAAVRLASVENEWNLTFKSIEIKNFVDASTFSSDMKKLVKEIKNKSSAHALQEQNILAATTEILSRGYDQWEFCNGHDATKLIAYGLKKRYGTRKDSDSTQERIEESLKLSFSIECFRRTELYSKIQEWESISSNKVLFI